MPQFIYYHAYDPHQYSSVAENSSCFMEALLSDPTTECTKRANQSLVVIEVGSDGFCY